METKAEYRAHLKARRDGLPADSRAAWSKVICDQLASFCRARRITRVAAFWPFGSEIDLRSTHGVSGFLLKDLVFEWFPWKLYRAKDHAHLRFTWRK